MQYDAVVIGAGHNGLVAAAYLARAGRRVLVLERRPQVGGCVVTEEVVEGFKFSRLAYVNSLFRPGIIRELRLRETGFEMLPRDPSSFTPFPDGRYLLLGPDRARNCEEIGKFSRRDAEVFPRYEAELDELARFIDPLLDLPPLDPVLGGPADLVAAVKFLWRARKLGAGFHRLVRMLTVSATSFLDEWFESEELKVTLATDAIIGALASPSEPGTSYVLLHHVMGECEGARGVWGYVRGGMGALSEAIAARARELGAEVRTGTSVAEVLVEGGRAVGVRTADGVEHRARTVLSNADPRVTFLDLVPPSALDAAFRRSIVSLDFSSGSFKLNLALSGLPSFRALPGSEPGPQHRGTVHIAPTMETIERAFADAREGRPSAVPVLECTIPSVLDPGLAPPGKHVMGIFVQYAPYELADGNWDGAKEGFTDRIIDLMEEYAPGFRDLVIAADAVSPLDMEREYSLTGGNIFHGAMAPAQLFFLRPVGGWSGYRTPVSGLYLCGAGAHPGGGVLGACGRNAAFQVLRDRRRGRL